MSKQFHSKKDLRDAIVAASKLSDSDTLTTGSGNKGVFLPDNWGSNWRQKLNNSNTANASIAMVGDSLTVGQYASNLDTKNLAGLLRIALQDKYGDGGSGYKSILENPQSLGSPYGSGGSPSVDSGSLISLTGTWVQSTTNTDGPGAQHLDAQVTGSTATYVVRGSTIKTYVVGGTGAGFGHYTVTIDGVVSATFNSGGLAANTCQVQTFTGLSPGNHTVVFTAGIGETLSGSLQVFFCGLQGLNSSGVVVNKYGRPSYPSAAFNNDTALTFYQSNGTLTGNGGNGGYAPSGKWSGGSLNPADLIIYGFGLNDCRPSGQATTPDTYLRNIYKYLYDVREGNPNAEVMLVLQHGGDPTWQEASTQYYAAYAERLRGVAASFNAAFVDFWSIGNNSWKYMKDMGYMGDTSGNAGISGSNPVHFSDAGFVWQKNIILPLLLK